MLGRGYTREVPPGPGIESCRNLSLGSILQGLHLEPLPGLWPRRADRFGEWPPARGGRVTGEEVMKGEKRPSRANLKELGSANTTKLPVGKTGARRGEWALGVGTSCVGVFVWLGVQSCGKVEFGVELYKSRVETVESHPGLRTSAPTRAIRFSAGVPSPYKTARWLHPGAPS